MFERDLHQYLSHACKHDQPVHVLVARHNVHGDIAFSIQPILAYTHGHPVNLTNGQDFRINAPKTGHASDCAEGPAQDQAEEFAKEEPKVGYSTGDHSCFSAGRSPSELEEARVLAYCAADVGKSLAELAQRVDITSPAVASLAKLMHTLSNAATDLISPPKQPTIEPELEAGAGDEMTRGKMAAISLAEHASRCRAGKVEFPVSIDGTRYFVTVERR